MSVPGTAAAGARRRLRACDAAASVAAGGTARGRAVVLDGGGAVRLRPGAVCCRCAECACLLAYSLVMRVGFFFLLKVSGIILFRYVIIFLLLF